MTPYLLGKHVNTYTFSKGLAEYMIFLEHKDLPVSVVRPSMTISSLKEPFPGWIDNFAGTTFYLWMVGRGLMRQIHSFKECKANLVPVDIVSNSTIAAAWETAVSPKPDVPKIYHACTGAYNEVNFGQVFKSSYELSRKYPVEGAMWYPTIKFIPNIYLNKVYSGLVEYLPAYFIDTVMRVFGKKPK
jgi:fatty acyl-CoA reductase